jgi:hypothetical protein
MALPVTISSVSFPNQNYYCGPFKAPNGAIYVVFVDSTDNDAVVYKCVDFDFPASAFTRQTTGGEPTTGDIQSLWAYLSGTHIHIVQWYDDGSDNYYLYHRFDTSDDTWETKDNTIETWDDKNEPTSPACSFAYRADGGSQYPYICLYNGAREKIGGSSYDRVDWAGDADGAGTWDSAGNAVDAGGESNYSGAVAVRGSAPDANGHVVHLFWGAALGAHSARTLRYTGSVWNLSSAVSAPAVTDGATRHHHGAGIYYDDSGTDRIIVPFRAETTLSPSVWMITEDSSGDLSGTGDAAYTIDSTYDLAIANLCVIISLAVDPVSGQAYAMWGEVAGDGSDLRRSDASPPWSSWASSTEEEAGTCNRISFNFFPRNGSLKLAFLWDDGGTIKYDEYDIGQETAPGFAAARLPEQNYKIGPFSV